VRASLRETRPGDDPFAPTPPGRRARAATRAAAPELPAPEQLAPRRIRPRHPRIPAGATACRWPARSCPRRACQELRDLRAAGHRACFRFERHDRARKRAAPSSVARLRQPPRRHAPGVSGGGEVKRVCGHPFHADSDPAAKAWRAAPTMIPPSPAEWAASLVLRWRQENERDFLVGPLEKAIAAATARKRHGGHRRVLGTRMDRADATRCRPPPWPFADQGAVRVRATPR